MMKKIKKNSSPINNLEGAFNDILEYMHDKLESKCLLIEYFEKDIINREDCKQPSFQIENKLKEERVIHQILNEINDAIIDFLESNNVNLEEVKEDNE